MLPVVSPQETSCYGFFQGSQRLRLEAVESQHGVRGKLLGRKPEMILGWAEHWGFDLAQSSPWSQSGSPAPISQALVLCGAACRCADASQARQ